MAGLFDKFIWEVIVTGKKYPNNVTMPFFCSHFATNILCTCQTAQGAQSAWEKKKKKNIQSNP